MTQKTLVDYRRAFSFRNADSTIRTLLGRVGAILDFKLANSIRWFVYFLGTPIRISR